MMVLYTMFHDMFKSTEWTIHFFSQINENLEVFSCKNTTFDVGYFLNVRSQTCGEI